MEKSRIVQRLSRLKSSIDKDTNLRAEERGKLKSHMAKLKEKFDIDSLEEAEILLEDMNESIETQAGILDKAITEAEELLHEPPTED